MKFFFCAVLTFIICLNGCSQIPQQINAAYDDTVLIIWDTDDVLNEHTTLLKKVNERFPETTHIKGRYPEEEMAPILKSLFDAVPSDSLCIFIVASGDPRFHQAIVWNIWMPELWRELSCKGKILIADAPWADEFINPLKAAKADTFLVVNGPLGHLRRKLPGSLLAASCGYDEINMVSKGIDGRTRTPIFSYYFLEALGSTTTGPAEEGNLLNAINQAAVLTRSAIDRGVLSELEEILFFQKSEIEKEEFFSFPHPVIWNGLARRISIGSP